MAKRVPGRKLVVPSNGIPNNTVDASSNEDSQPIKVWMFMLFSLSAVLQLYAIYC